LFDFPAKRARARFAAAVIAVACGGWGLSGASPNHSWEIASEIDEKNAEHDARANRRDKLTALEHRRTQSL
jgi:hypothetical protein